MMLEVYDGYLTLTKSRLPMITQHSWPKDVGTLVTFGQKVNNLLHMLPSSFQQRRFFLCCPFSRPLPPKAMLKHWTD